MVWGQALTPTNNLLAPLVVFVLMIYPPVIRCGLIQTNSYYYIANYSIPVHCLLYHTLPIIPYIAYYTIPVHCPFHTWVLSSISPQVWLGLNLVKFGLVTTLTKPGG